MRYFQVNGIMYAVIGYRINIFNDAVSVINTDEESDSRIFLFDSAQALRNQIVASVLCGKIIDGIKIDTKNQTFELVYK